MWSLLVSLTLAAAPPAARATQLAEKKAWDELLLGFATVKASDVSAKDAARISEALTRGCLALEHEDPVMAFDLGKHAAALKPGAEALLCWARTAQKTDQRQSAEDALRLGMAQHRKDGRFPLELGQQLLKEGDPSRALETLEAVPVRSPEAAEARALAQRARALAQKDRSTRKEGPEKKGRSAPVEAASDPEMVGFESGTGPGDLRTRSNRYFHFKYFNNQRDFGQRAEFEGQIAGAMESARRHSVSVLGVAREAPVDVILYTREEFALHHGEQAARVIAGLYSQNAIRVNAALELTPEHRATLAHEYVHAVVDETAGGRSDRVPTWMNEGIAEYLEWRYLGMDDPPVGLRARLRAAARSGALPSLTGLSSGALVGRADPGLLYAYSAVAARTLMQQSGGSAYLRAVSALAQGQPVDEVFRAQFGTSLSDLERNLVSELSGQ